MNHKLKLTLINSSYLQLHIKEKERLKHVGKPQRTLSYLRLVYLKDLRADEAVHKEGGDSVERAITTAASLDVAQDSDNITRTQTTTIPNVDILQGMDTGGSPRRQDTMGGGAPAQTRSKRVLEKSNEPPLSEGHTSGSGEGRMENQFELTANVPITPHDSPLPRDYTPRSEDGRPKLQELMTMCIKLSKQVFGLEKEKEEI
ncbi:hypothetical protein Tco_0669402 [Tanacetum coccineum]